MKKQKSLFITSIILFISMTFVSALENDCYSQKANAGKEMKKGFQKIGKGISKVGKDAVKFLKEIKKVVKCIPKLSRGIVHLAKNPHDKQVLSSLQKCINDVNQMSSTCDKPEIMALSVAPDIGSEIAFSCAQVGKYDTKLQLLENKMQQAENLMQDPEDAAENLAMNKVHKKMQQEEGEEEEQE